MIIAPMMTRRDWIAGSLLLAGVYPAASGAAPAPPDETGESLIALPGKKPLIRRSFRPPNFETPLADLRTLYTPNEAFFVRYHLPVIPEIDPRAWRLTIAGASLKRPVTLSREDLRRNFRQVEIAAVNQCSGNRRGLFSPRVPGVQWGHGAVGNAAWRGVRLRDVLEKCGVAADAVEALFDGADTPLLPSTPDFVKSLPIERALDESTLIALEMNRRPLPHWNGAPARLVVPGWTATYWVKHLTSIRVEPAPFDGFWMKSAYRLPAGVFPGARFLSQETAETAPITEILINSLITSHVQGQRLARHAPAELSGWAWDGGSGIAAVEVSTDGGRIWRECGLGEDLGRYAWRSFHRPIDTSRLGPLELAVRAKSRAGSVQPARLTANPSGYHHNAVQRLRLEVAA